MIYGSVVRGELAVCKTVKVWGSTPLTPFGEETW